MRRNEPPWFGDVEDPQVDQFYVNSGQFTGRTAGKFSGPNEVVSYRWWDPHTLEWSDKETLEDAI